MDSIQCAVLLAKLERFTWEIEKRIEVGARYNEMMDKEGIERVHQRDDRTTVFAQYTIMSDTRDSLALKLKASGVPSAVHYPVPLNEQPAYQHLCCPDCTPVAQTVAKRVISLPMGPDLSLADQDFITRSLVD